MEDVKVYTPETIQDNPFPVDNQVVSDGSQSTTGGVYSSEKIGDSEFPTKRIAVEVISSKLNTQSKKILAEFSFTESGAIRVGKYEDGESGDIRISPDGIVARNKAGDTTFALDGETGDATFAGAIQAGSVITGEVIVGDNNIILDGANKRIIINDGSYDRILMGFQKNGF